MGLCTNYAFARDRILHGDGCTGSGTDPVDGGRHHARPRRGAQVHSGDDLSGDAGPVWFLGVTGIIRCGVLGASAADDGP